MILYKINIINLIIILKIPYLVVIKTLINKDREYLILIL